MAMQRRERVPALDCERWARSRIGLSRNGSIDEMLTVSIGDFSYSSDDRARLLLVRITLLAVVLK